MATIFKLPELAREKSTFVVTAAFHDENGDAMTPATATWTLSAQDGTVINAREDVTITTPTSTETIVLSGADLDMADGSPNEISRRLTVKGTFDSSAGTGLPFVDMCDFSIIKDVTD